jgi:hypothetical protein
MYIFINIQKNIKNLFLADLHLEFDIYCFSFSIRIVKTVSIAKKENKHHKKIFFSIALFSVAICNIGFKIR